MKLRDPDVCPAGHRKTRIIDSKRRIGYRRRIHRCCICGLRWPSFQSLINPKYVHLSGRKVAAA